MENSIFNINEIKELMTHMNENSISKFKLQLSDDAKIEIESQKNIIHSTCEPQAPTITQPAAPAVQPQETPDAKAIGTEITSPLVGTFYKSPAPDKPAFAPVGSKVSKGDTLFIIESMKLMNEVTAEIDGEVVEVCVNDTQAVEFGQVIMIIK